MRQLVNETEQVRLSESQLSKRVRVEEELDQPFAISVRSAATIQVPLLRVQVQGEDRHTKAHQDEAQEQGCLRDRCVPIVATPSVRTRTNLQRIDKFEEKREEIHFSRPSSFDQGFPRFLFPRFEGKCPVKLSAVEEEGLILVDVSHASLFSFSFCVSWLQDICVDYYANNILTTSQSFRITFRFFFFFFYLRSEKDSLFSKKICSRREESRCLFKRKRMIFFSFEKDD